MFLHFAPSFMGLLANALLERHQNEIMGILVSIFGRSGIGHATEYAFHNTILGCCSESYGVTETNELVVMDLGNIRKRLIRNIEDIANIKEHEYLLPIIVNFPVIDSLARIIGNKYILFQSTINKTLHDIAEDDWNRIYQLISPHATIIYFVWVLTKDNFKSFKYHKYLLDFEKVVQLKMFSENVSKTVVLSELSVGNKRATKRPRTRKAEEALQQPSNKTDILQWIEGNSVRSLFVFSFV